MVSVLRSSGRGRGVVGASIVAGLLVVLAGSLVFVSVSAAAEPVSAWWRLGSESRPTNLPPGGEGVIVAYASNLGDAPVQGAATPVTLTDTLPAGITATGASANAGLAGSPRINKNPAVSCSGSSVVVCSYAGPL